MGLVFSTVLLAGFSTPRPAAAATYWPVMCRGPVQGITLHPGRLTIVARPGSVGSRPRRGECVWLDRGMTRLGEITPRGTVVFRLRYARPDAAARLLSNAVTGRVFRFIAVRTGAGVYDAAFRVPPGNRLGNPRDPGRVVPPPPPPGTHAVRVTFERIRILRDGDRISPGEWVVSVVARADGRRRTTTAMRWPRRGIAKVDDGERVRVGYSMIVNGLRPGDPLRIAVRALECDADTLLDFGGRLPGEVGDLFRAAAEATGSGRCPAEDFGELSGRNDVARSRIVIPARDLSHSNRIVETIAGDGLRATIVLRVDPIR